MKVAVLSGKGGTGKTFVSVNLAVTAGTATYIDCDVEEPNGRLFFKPEGIEIEEVHTFIPKVNADLCSGCRACVDFCHFHALVFIREKPMIFSDVCHSCGGCMLVCPTKAMEEAPHQVGIVETGIRGQVRVVTGILNAGEASAVPTIQATLKKGCEQDETTIIDCPPGSSCAVMESISDADYCILVVEPTSFGFHNFKMVYELVTLIKKPCGIIINKADQPYEPLLDFCKEHEITILLEIPYDSEIAKLSADGEIGVEQKETLAKDFKQLLSRLEVEVGV